MGSDSEKSAQSALLIVHLIDGVKCHGRNESWDIFIRKFFPIDWC